MIAEKTLSEIRVERDYYTTKQVSEIYHVSQPTVCNWLRKGWLQGEKKSDGKNSRWHIFPQQLEDEIEQRRDELIEASKRYWIRLLVQMRK